MCKVNVGEKYSLDGLLIQVVSTHLTEKGWIIGYIAALGGHVEEMNEDVFLRSVEPREKETRA